MREGRNEAPEKRGAMQTVLNVVGVILCVIFIPIIILNMVMIVRSYTDPDHIPSVFGVSPVIVLSGSMSPTFETGDMIFIQKTDPYSLQVDDVICYMEEESAVTHRIIEVQYEGSSPVYITQGDANNVEDAVPVTPEQVQGKYMNFAISGAGDFAIFLQSVPGMLIFIGGPVLLFLLWDVFRRIIAGRRQKGEQKQQSAEREAMEQELERLRAQLGASPQEGLDAQAAGAMPAPPVEGSPNGDGPGGNTP